jgi:hypothetical protein
VIASGAVEIATAAYATYARLQTGEIVAWGDKQNIPMSSGMGFQETPVTIAGFP